MVIVALLALFGAGSAGGEQETVTTKQFASGDNHRTNLILSGRPGGRFRIFLDGRPAGSVTINEDENAVILPVKAVGTSKVVLRKGLAGEVSTE